MSNIANVVSVASPIYSAPDNSTIDCQVVFALDDGSEVGPWPYTANPDDPSPYALAVFETAQQMGPAPYVARPPVIPAQVSRRQFFQAAATLGIITEDEAVAVLAIGAVPTSLAAAISALPTADRFAAKMAILGDQDFARTGATLASLATAMGKTDADLDALFILASGL